MNDARKAQDFASFLRMTMAMRGVSSARLTTMDDALDQSILSRWLSGEMTPPPDKLRVLSNLLNVPYVDLMMAADYLEPADICRDDTSNPPPAASQHDVLAAIRADVTLRPEAKKHLGEMYMWLRKLPPQRARASRESVSLPRP